MRISEMETRFHRSFKDTYHIGIFVIILIIIDTVTSINLYYAQYCMLFLCIVTAFLSYRNFCSIDNEGITIYYGPSYYRKSIFLAWNDISSIVSESDDYSYIGSTGAFHISAKISHSIPAIKIGLKDPLRPDVQTEIKKVLNKYIFLQVERINENGTELIIRDVPYGGFKKFINKVSLVAGTDYKKKLTPAFNGARGPCAQ